MPSPLTATAMKHKTREMAEQEALDDFSETMGKLKKSTSQANLLAVRIEAEIEKARDSSRPSQAPKEKLDEPARRSS